MFDYISKKDFLTEEEAIDFTRQILLALQHLHSRSVVHLDLKVWFKVTMWLHSINIAQITIVLKIDALKSLQTFNFVRVTYFDKVLRQLSMVSCAKLSRLARSAVVFLGCYT